MAYMLLFPQPGIEPMAPALQGGFLTTGPPGKSQEGYLKMNQSPAAVCPGGKTQGKG